MKIKNIHKSAFSIVFHNVHNNDSPKLHGSISANKLKNIIIFLKKNYNLIDADIFLNKLNNKKLESKDVCLSFDDGLKSQFNIALPVLDNYNLKAFFFVFSESFDNKISNLELFKYYRSTQFKNIDVFYTSFILYLKKLNINNINIIKKNFIKLNYLNNFKFYTTNDKFFRYLRDMILTDEEYNKIMFMMIDDNNFDMKKVSKKLYFTLSNLKHIHKKKHIIGLHSHTHPTNIDTFSYKDQFKEYKYNKTFIEKNLNCKVDIMAHPCGKFNLDTVKVLNKLNIKNAFGVSLNNNRNPMNLSRLDCAYL